MIVKRLFDIFAACLGLVVLSPVMLAVALAIKRDDGGPVFFRQIRVGRLGKPFSILKFRTMLQNADTLGPSITADRDSRITRTGNFLRVSKIDELPQLINVLTGAMSIVGPRPEVPEYVALYPADVHRKVLSVRPGLTDFASVIFSRESELLSAAKDRHKTYVEEILPTKLKYQLRYVDERSLWVDLKIITMTLSRIIRPRKDFSI